MALVDYSLERSPEHLIESFDDLELADQLEIELPDIEAENQAHLVNVMIASWIEQLATWASGSHSHFMPDHTYVGLHEVKVEGDVQIEEFEVGFFRRSDQKDPLVPPEPVITLYSFREQLLDTSVISASFGFRCEEISTEAEEAIYQRVLDAASAADYLA